MQGELARKNTTLPGRARWLGANPPWQGLALAAVLMLTALLNLYGLTGEGYANSYYAAAVKNMLTSWQNFFFVSFDAGFVSVDKPPLGCGCRRRARGCSALAGLASCCPRR